MNKITNSFKEFAEKIKKYSIAPKDIEKEDYKKSYLNLSEGYPKYHNSKITPNIKPVRIGDISQSESQYESQYESQNENYYGSRYQSEYESNPENNGKRRNKKKYKSQYESQNGESQSETGKSQDAKVEKKIFGQHINYSFYEYYAREIVFQLLKYPKMSYRKYEMEIDNDRENKLIEKWVSDEIEAKVNKVKPPSSQNIQNSGLSTQNIEGKTPNDIKSSVFQNKEKNCSKIIEEKKEIKDEDNKACDKNKEKKEVKDEDNKACEKNNEKNSSKIMEEKKEVKDEDNKACDKKKEFAEKDDKKRKSDVLAFNSAIKSSSEVETQPDTYLTKTMTSYNKKPFWFIEDEKYKDYNDKGDETMNKNNKKDNHNIKRYKIKGMEKKKALSQTKPKIKKEKRLNYLINKDKRFKSSDLKKKKGYYSAKILSERTFLIKGDFDFLVHSLEGSTLEEVLTNENISPFIYFGNFDIKANKKYDIIGEIKENSGYQDISQVKKYLHLLYNLEKHPEFNDEMKFRKENKKIMMYVFNHSFQRFIENILDFKINREKFKNMKNFQYECFHNIVGYIEKKDKVKDNPRSLLMKIVIESGLPFVFIFVDNMKSMMDINQMDKIDSNIKTKELEKQVDDLRKKWNKKI